MARRIRPFLQLSDALGSRYGALLVVLVVTLVVYSFVGSSKIMLWIMDLTAVGILAFALRAIPGTRRAFIVTLTIGLASIVAGTLGGSFSIDTAYPSGAGLRALFLGCLVGSIVLDIANRDRVTMDSVFGAACVYLLLGLAWGSLYTLLEWIEPESFEHIRKASGAGARLRSTESDLVYFSMVTMTTVGYGDIAPSTPPARTLAALEALVAQLFLAIVIARFVALEITSRQLRRIVLTTTLMETH